MAAFTIAKFKSPSDTAATVPSLLRHRHHILSPGISGNTVISPPSPNIKAASTTANIEPPSGTTATVLNTLLSSLLKSQLLLLLRYNRCCYCRPKWSHLSAPLPLPSLLKHAAAAIAPTPLKQCHNLKGNHACNVEPRKFKYIYLYATLYVFTLTFPIAAAMYYVLGLINSSTMPMLSPPPSY